MEHNPIKWNMGASGSVTTYTGEAARSMFAQLSGQTYTSTQGSGSAPANDLTIQEGTKENTAIDYSMIDENNYQAVEGGSFTAPANNDQYEWKDFASTAGQTNWWLTLNVTVLSTAPGTIRFTTTELGFAPWYYSDGFMGNQYFKAYKVGQVGKMISRGLVGFGIFFDGVSYLKGDISGSKFAVNTGVGLWGLTGVGTVPAIFYFGAEAFFPGGARGAMNFQVETQNQLNKISNYKIRLVPFGPK